MSALGAENVVESGRRVLRMEAEALARAAERVGGAFEEAVELIAGVGGRVIVSGVGKSGLVARKIAATLTSTGTPATFLHPVDALHGDLGIVGAGDVALLLSKSGESEELAGLLGFLSRSDVPVVGLTGRTDSTLGRNATVVLDTSVDEEACPLDLAPTCSTTVAMAVGDALAVSLLMRRGFRREDFARLHPGGSLGRRLLLRVRDVMVTEDLPLLPPDATMRECTVLLAHRRGTAAVVDGEDRLLGVVTAGDLTRLMDREERFFERTVSTVMTPSPQATEPEQLGATAVGIMERKGVMALPVLEDGRVVGMVHLHDLMRAGVV